MAHWRVREVKVHQGVKEVITHPGVKVVTVHQKVREVKVHQGVREVMTQLGLSVLQNHQYREVQGQVKRVKHNKDLEEPLLRVCHKPHPDREEKVLCGYLIFII